MLLRKYHFDGPNLVSSANRPAETSIAADEAYRRPVSMRNLVLFLRPEHQPGAETRSGKIGGGP